MRRLEHDRTVEHACLEKMQCLLAPSGRRRSGRHALRAWWTGLTYVFLSPEMFALYFLGITAIISITSENILKGLISAALAS